MQHLVIVLFVCGTIDGQSPEPVDSKSVIDLDSSSTILVLAVLGGLTLLVLLGVGQSWPTCFDRP